MFKFKYEIVLTNTEKIWLFGEDYFGDKKVFWDAHQTTLKNLVKKVEQTGLPLKITALKQGNTLTIETMNQFHQWLINTQPYSSNK